MSDKNEYIIRLNDKEIKVSKELYDLVEPFGKLIDELQQYKDNWNELKEFLENNWKETQDIWFVKIITKMKELERGVSDVED